MMTYQDILYSFIYETPELGDANILAWNVTTHGGLDTEENIKKEA